MKAIMAYQACTNNTNQTACIRISRKTIIGRKLVLRF